MALLLGLSAGHPSPLVLTMVLAMFGIAAMVLAALQPFPAFLVLIGSTILLVTVVTPLGFALNAFDLLLPPLLLALVFGPLRTRLAGEEAAMTGPEHASLRAAADGFVRSVVALFVLAALSVGMVAVTGRAGPAVHSAQALVREIEVLLVFPVALWCVRDAKALRRVLMSLLVAGAVSVTVNAVAISAFHVERAGITWFLNNPEWPIADPNEAGFAMVMVIAVLLIFHAERPRAVRRRETAAPSTACALPADL